MCQPGKATTQYTDFSRQGVGSVSRRIKKVSLNFTNDRGLVLWAG